MRKKISRMFGLLVLVMTMAVLSGGVVKAEEVGGGENIGENDNHRHDWTYKKNEETNTITATCSDETCQYYKPGVSFSLSITKNNNEVNAETNPIYEEEEYIVAVVSEGTLEKEEIEKITSDVKYSYKEDKQQEYAEQKPSTQGNYSVKAQFGENTDSSITKAFEIKAKQHDHEWNYKKVEGKEEIQATCSNETCQYHKSGVSFSLSITKNNNEVNAETNPIYEEEEYIVAVVSEETLEKEEIEKITSDVKYSYKEDKQQEYAEQKPSTQGNYSVKAQFGENTNSSITKAFEIKAKQHDHEWNYKKVEGKEEIQATCSDETCQYHESVIIISLDVGNPTCDGYKGASVTNIDKLELGEENEPSIIYYLDDNNNKKTTSENGADEEGGVPKEVGKYYAKIEFEGKDSNVVTLKKEFNIKHDYKVSIEWENTTPKIKEIACTRNSNHKVSPENIDVKFDTSDIETKPATCVSEGIRTYTTIATVDGKEYKDTKVVTTKAKGYKWNKGKVTKKSTDKAEGVYTYTCTNGCKHTKTEIIPKKSITVELGKKANIVSKASACQKMKLANASKYKKYLTFNTKTGEIKTKKYYKVKINKSIPVKVTIGGRNYTVPIKIKIPAPSVKITKKAGKDSYGKYYRYTFKYNIKGASKIQVRVENAKKTGKEKSINKTFDKYVKKSKSNKSSYVEFSDTTMKKLKNKNNKVTFKIIAYYGNNKSETLIVKK